MPVCKNASACMHFTPGVPFSVQKIHFRDKNNISKCTKKKLYQRVL